MDATEATAGTETVATEVAAREVAAVSKAENTEAVEADQVVEVTEPNADVDTNLKIKSY